MGSEGGSKHGGKGFDRILNIGIPYLLMNLIFCHGFLKNMNTVVILKFLKRVLEYYFSKGFTILEWNDNNLEKIPKEVEQRIRVKEKKIRKIQDMYQHNSLYIKHTEEIGSK